MFLIIPLSKDKLIIIKKYPNRRLYNTDESRYITLEDLSDLVKTDKEFKVVDAKSKEDVTRITLVQVILNHELEGYNVLPVELIKQLIKLYDNPLSKGFSAFMINALNQFNNSLEAYKVSFDNHKGAGSPNDWVDYLHNMNAKNAEFMADLIKKMTGHNNSK